MTPVFADINELSLGSSASSSRSPSRSPSGPRSEAARPTASSPAERSITGGQNGFAISGDFISASTLPGSDRAGLPRRNGPEADPRFTLLSFPVVLFLIAERMRNAGIFTTLGAGVLIQALAGSASRSP